MAREGNGPTSAQPEVPAAGHGRDETVEERADRMWNDLVQELRIAQAGARSSSGFRSSLCFSPCSITWLTLSVPCMSVLCARGQRASVPSSARWPLTGL